MQRLSPQVKTAAQAIVNMMVMMRLMPVTGITLPFVSYGGSSLVSSFMAVGLLLNVRKEDLAAVLAVLLECPFTRREKGRIIDRLC